MITLADLLGQAVQPPVNEPGRRYPRVQNAPYGLDIPGEVLQPQDLPNPYGIKHRDPIELEQLRPMIQPGPDWGVTYRVR
jgi:hypothetical protein